LTLTAGKCVSMELVPEENAALWAKYLASPKEPVMILALRDGTEVGREPASHGKISAKAVEKLLRVTIDRREEAANRLLEAAKQKIKQKDTEGAMALCTQVWEQRCLLPAQAKRAAKELKKLGNPIPALELSRLNVGEPVFSEPRNSEIMRVMSAGLAAESKADILEARRLYSLAGKMDPSDPVPACYLGELLRHHVGDWTGARAVFSRILEMRADPVSRAVALHGLGKMTIHDGEFSKGLELFEASLEAWPLALTYRNLAVYWNSEKQGAKAYGYVKKALEIDPEDEYNQIFAATFLSALGHPQEAERIAAQHEQLLEASYNLAVIYAQLGDKEKMIELLRRHFFVYEQFDAVRAKEMQEARDDIAFERYHHDPDFLKLTALADTDASSYHHKKT
jgi:tetratricopeptide (TPR) repeat protein